MEEWVSGCSVMDTTDPRDDTPGALPPGFESPSALFGFCCPQDRVVLGEDPVFGNLLSEIHLWIS